jgi:hypothetical protein
MKECSSCGLPKSDNAFPDDPGSNDGLGDDCYKCTGTKEQAMHEKIVKSYKRFRDHAPQFPRWR